MNKTIDPKRVDGRLTPPPSKSYAQRAIAAALLSQGQTVIRGLGTCDDTRSALAVAGLLGARTVQADETCTVTGGLAPRAHTIDIGQSGLAARMFTPIAALCGIPVTVTGHGPIMHRPMDMMVGPLRRLGVQAEDRDGYLPVTVQGPIAGGEAHVDGSVSSQFLTGLLMALPLAAQDTVLYVSRLMGTPYIDMTIDLARSFGVSIEHRNYEEFFIPAGQPYHCPEYEIEGDWSAASCMLVAGAVAGKVTLENLNPLSMQADAAVIEALSRAGAQITTSAGTITVEQAELAAFAFDATHCPDLFPALAALAAHCRGVSEITGTNRLVHKESDRAAALQDVFGRMGIDVDLSQPDVMRITGGIPHSAEVSAHGDHRIAMAAAVAGLAADGPVTVHGAEAVAKSYPAFWDDLESL